MLATYLRAGLAVTWAVDCERGQARVGKAQVLTFSSLVEDIGPDRGIILAGHGFQAGARQATDRSDAVATSRAALCRDAASTLAEQRLLAYPKRLAAISLDYRSRPKTHRIEYGLRLELAEHQYGATRVLTASRAVLLAELTGNFTSDPVFGLPDGAM